jgi:hypothetical protein
VRYKSLVVISVFSEVFLHSFGGHHLLHQDSRLVFDRETLQEMGLDDYRVENFSSDYDGTFVDESGYNFDAHGA